MIGQTVVSPMRYEIVATSKYIRADLYYRRTAEETARFLAAVADECLRLNCFRVLVSVHFSKPIFTLEKYGFSTFIELARTHSGQYAAVTDNREMRIAHDYAVMLARLRGVNIRTFRDETAAIAWLENGER